MKSIDMNDMEFVDKAINHIATRIIATDKPDAETIKALAELINARAKHSKFSYKL